MNETRKQRSTQTRRQFVKREAIQILLDGHSAASAVDPATHFGFPQRSR